MTLTNPRNLTAFYTVCTSAILFYGCVQKSAVTKDSNQRVVTDAVQAAIRSTSDLSRLLLNGIGTNEIVSHLGLPSWKEILDGDREVWYHNLPPFPAAAEMKGSYIAGVTIGLTNGHLARWDCIYVNSPSSQREELLPTSSVNFGLNKSTTLTFFVVSRDPILNGRFVDTERFPKLGFVSSNPILTVHKLKEVTLKEQVASGTDQQKKLVWSFGIFLNQEDATRLKALTAANNVSNLLITVGDNYVSALTISSQLETGSFVIECNERTLMETVKEQLINMERKK